MSKCSNCLCEKVCRYNDGHNLYCKNDYVCPHFTDRSKLVNLPCKVGDKLYEITSRKTISEYQVTAIRIELFGIFVDWKITQGFVDKYISGMPAGEIGNSVFLTREEAEKALEEKNKE